MDTIPGETTCAGMHLLPYICIHDQLYVDFCLFAHRPAVIHIYQHSLERAVELDKVSYADILRDLFHIHQPVVPDGMAEGRNRGRAAENRAFRAPVPVAQRPAEPAFSLHFPECAE